MVETHRQFVVNIYTIMVKLQVLYIIFLHCLIIHKLHVNEIIIRIVLYSSLAIVMNTIGQ